MNDKILEICALQSKMYDQMMKIDEAVLKATQMDEVVASVTQLVKDVQSFGYTDINVDRIKSCEALKEFCNVDMCLKYKSVEALSTDTIKEAFKKFLKMIVDVVRKIIEFIQDLFNTTAAKEDKSVLDSLRESMKKWNAGRAVTGKYAAIWRKVAFSLIALDRKFKSAAAPAPAEPGK